jgi:hypothetical protein
MQQVQADETAVEFSVLHALRYSCHWAYYPGRHTFIP